MHNQFTVPLSSWRRVAVLLVGVLAGIGTQPANCWAIDIFDRHDSALLRQVTEGATAQSEISQSYAAKLKPLAKDIESTCLIVETAKGNVAKALISWGFRKHPQTDQPIQVIMLDRFVTYQRDKGDSTVANGKNVMLFPGFQFDFDLGQIVPPGFDAEIELTDKGVVKALASTKLFGVDGSQLPAAEASVSPRKSADGIMPEDFSGVWQVDGDGRWIGEWDLSVNEQGQATGKFLSAETQASYPVSGQVGGVANQIKLQVEFNNATQVVDAYLWTRDKNRLAGTFTMSGRKFGVMAVRKEVR